MQPRAPQGGAVKRLGGFDSRHEEQTPFSHIPFLLKPQMLILQIQPLTTDLNIRKCRLSP